MIRILLADDHPMIRTAIEVLLRDTQFELAATAMNGAEALAEVERLKPDILLVDLEMPEVGGMDVIRKLKSDRMTSRLVILTAAIDDSSLMEARSLRVNGMVLKNSDPAYLLECLEAVAAGRTWMDPELQARADQLADPDAEQPAPAQRPGVDLR